MLSFIEFIILFEAKHRPRKSGCKSCPKVAVWKIRVSRICAQIVFAILKVSSRATVFYVLADGKSLLQAPQEAICSKENIISCEQKK